MLEEGKRYENMSWRIFSRESFCCRAQSQSKSLPTTFAPAAKRAAPLSEDLPELSSSLESNSSCAHTDLATHSCPTSARPELRRLDSDDCHIRKEKHLSPFDLEKIVISIKKKSAIEPLSPLPASFTVQPPTPAEAQQVIDQFEPLLEQQQHQEPATIFHSQIIPDSSTSTVATAIGSEYSEMSFSLAKTDSASTEVSTTSIVRGFSRDKISSSTRSRVQLAPASASSSILKPTPGQRPSTPPKRKKATFQIGGSSGEGDESSFETRFNTRSSLSEGLKQSKKVTSFKDEVLTRTIQDKTYESEEVFEDSDEEQSESAIEDEDEDDEEWEDEAEASDAPPMDDKELFQRVDSRPNLTSRRSLLTSMMHEKDRAAALQNAASRSTPAIRRSRTSSPNGPIGMSPTEEEVPEAFRSQMQTSRAKPIITPTSNTYSLALSPRTTRRNMLFSELTESVRMNLLWERQAKKPRATKSSITRRHTSNDVKNLKEFPGDTQSAPYLNPLREENPSSWNHYFDTGLQEYHQKGW